MSNLNGYFERNLESIPYLNRLISEWEQHDKIIIACDFDDTIFPWKMNNTDFKRIINILKDARNVGAYIVIFTARESDRHEEVIKYCSEIGLEIDGINKTPIDLPYGNNTKIYANIFIDDRAGLNESLNILEMAMDVIRNKKS
jgi:hypothetical protein